MEEATPEFPLNPVASLLPLQKSSILFVGIDFGGKVAYSEEPFTRK